MFKRLFCGFFGIFAFSSLFGALYGLATPISTIYYISTGNPGSGFVSGSTWAFMAFQTAGFIYGFWRGPLLIYSFGYGVRDGIVEAVSGTKQEEVDGKSLYDRYRSERDS